MRPCANDRGSAAVEFALVAPLLFAILLGIMAFGYAFHVQSVLSNAARDAVRVMALQDDVTAARNQAIESAQPSVDSTAMKIDITPTTCTGTGGKNATVTITYPVSMLGVIEDIELTGKGTMRCNG